MTSTPDDVEYEPIRVETQLDGRKLSTPNDTMGMSLGEAKLGSLKRTLTRTFSMSSTEETLPQYRILPIFSGVVVPFSILLAIPSLTGHWYIRTGENGVVVDSKPNTLLLMTGMSISLVCAVLASACLVVRFAERGPGVKPMTLLCIFFLTVHDIISFATVTAFGIEHRFDDGFTYGQPFWMTVCSTATSTITNITLVTDFVSTPNFATSGSGLTRKQRNLVVIIIVLFVYLAIGALVQSVLLKLTFIDALYFAVVSIETVGFGDIHPTTTGSRIFTMVYVTFGILNLAVAVASTRDALLEGIVAYLQRRIRAIKNRERKRRVHSRWRDAIKWRLRAQRLPIWVDLPQHDASSTSQGLRDHLRAWRRKINSPNFDTDRRHARTHRLRPRRLNVEALTMSQLEAAALEAGAPLTSLLPPGFIPFDSDADTWQPLPSPGKHQISALSPLTHIRIGGMANLLSSFAFAMTHGERGVLDGNTRDVDDADDEPDGDSPTTMGPRTGIPMSRTPTLDGPTLANLIENEEKLAFNVRLAAALLLFLVFWMAGSAIFSRTEGWAFGSAVYFCFITFTTLGYGDLAPRTAAGRSIFVAWALLGIGTMTILVAILADLYSARYKQAIHTAIYQKVNLYNDPWGTTVANLPRIQSLPRSATMITLASSPLASSPLASAPLGALVQGEEEDRLRSVSFAQTPTILNQKINENNPIDDLTTATIRQPPLDLDSVPLQSSGSLREELARQIQTLKSLLQDAGKENGDSTVIRSLQAMLENIEHESRRL